MCPACGSGDVTHVDVGMPADPEEAPPWVQFGGCVINGGEKTRSCAACHHAWSEVVIAEPVRTVATGRTKTSASPTRRRDSASDADNKE